MEDFQYEEGKSFNVTHEMSNAFETNGFIIVRHLLSEKELKALKLFVENESTFRTKNLERSDGMGLMAKLSIWNHPGNDMTGMVARCERVVNTCEKLIGGEVYHYHTKLMMKDAHTGGAFLWHQDYGYWYENGCLFPDMLTVFIAIDKAEKQNGCLQILPGSHKAGRIDHVPIGDQVAADPARVKELEKVCKLDYLELEAGDAAFFHCNLLHKSNQNKSDNRRWAFLCAYNRVSNNPVIKHCHPQYTPLIKVPDTAILECKSEFNAEEKDFFKNLQTDTAFEKMQRKDKTKTH